jgi:hypothetical protein
MDANIAQIPTAKPYAKKLMPLTLFKANSILACWHLQNVIEYKTL